MFVKLCQNKTYDSRNVLNFNSNFVLGKKVFQTFIMVYYRIVSNKRSRLINAIIKDSIFSYVLTWPGVYECRKTP